MRFAWTSAISVGVDAIDAQHKELFHRVDRLLDVVERRAAERELMRVLAFLGDYVVTHFADEEALMAERRYPDAAAHAAEHAVFTARFDRLRTAFARGGADPPLADEVRRQLCDWLVRHVSGTDLALGIFVRRMPVPPAPIVPAK
jgi:hemerythrin